MYWLDGFVLFRILAIVTPWPIGGLERRCTGERDVRIDDPGAGLAIGNARQGLGRL